MVTDRWRRDIRAVIPVIRLWCPLKVCHMGSMCIQKNRRAWGRPHRMLSWRNLSLVHKRTYSGHIKYSPCLMPDSHVKIFLCVSPLLPLWAQGTPQAVSLPATTDVAAVARWGGVTQTRLSILLWLALPVLFLSLEITTSFAVTSRTLWKMHDWLRSNVLTSLTILCQYKWLISHSDLCNSQKFCSRLFSKFPPDCMIYLFFYLWLFGPSS